MKWHLLLPLTTVLAGTTIAAAQPRGASSPPRGRSMLADVGSAEFEPILKASGMSPAGIAALRNAPRLDERPDAVHVADCAVEKLVARSPLNVAALDRALVQRNALATAEAERRRVWLIGLLRRVDARDAALLLKLVGPGNSAGASARYGPPPGPPHANNGFADRDERPIGPPPGPPPDGGRTRCD